MSPECRTAMLAWHETDLHAETKIYMICRVKIKQQRSVIIIRLICIIFFGRSNLNACRSWKLFCLLFGAEILLTLKDLIVHN